jgi:hypothetical protein
MYDINLIPENIKQYIVVNDDGCWIWQRAKTKFGYGNYNVYNEDGSYKNYYVHRVVYEIYKGKIAKGLFVCHSCDVPSCCNPEHLWIGTPKQNTVDAMNKGRLNPESRKHYESLPIEQIRKDYTDELYTILKLTEKYETTPYFIHKALGDLLSQQDNSRGPHRKRKFPLDKIKEAKAFWQANNYTLMEVNEILKLGFTDYSYMCRLFKKV